MENKSQQVGAKSEIPVPKEFEGKSLGSPPTKEETLSTDGVVATPDLNKENIMEHLDNYAKHLHSYIREYISAADRKASFIFAIGAALLVYLYEKEITSIWIKPIKTWGMNDLASFLATYGLAISCVIAVAVIFPSLKGSRRGLLFWESVAEFNTSTEFVEELQKLGCAQLTDEILRHSHEISWVCRRKYVLLNLSIRIGAVGAVSAIIYLANG